MRENRTDTRLIIEKGGYTPNRGGPTHPPARPPQLAQDGGYRPTTGGPTTPPPKPAPNTAPKK